MFRLPPHLLSSCNFNTLQSAYRVGHSTETAVLLFHRRWQQADHSHCLDISAAFDTISHGILLKRLEIKFGVQGIALSWLQSYLTDGFQFIKLGRHCSKTVTCSSGPKLFANPTRCGNATHVLYDFSRWYSQYIIQPTVYDYHSIACTIDVHGQLATYTADVWVQIPYRKLINMALKASHLGGAWPMLFVIYISPVGDLIMSHGVSHHQYADDTQLFLTIKAFSISANLESCSHAVKGWFAVNNLMLNTDKSDVMLIETSAQLRAADHISEIVVAGTDLKTVAVIKSLGFILDSRLTFAAHVTAVCKACNYHIWALRHIRHLLTHDVANTLACSIVGARIDYCNSILRCVDVRRLPSCNVWSTPWLVWCCSNRDELMRSPFCGHFTGFPSNIGWLTSWPSLRSTCDSRRHQRTCHCI